MKKPKQCVMYKFCGKEIPKHRHNFCSDKCRDLCNHTYYEKGELIIDERYILKKQGKQVKICNMKIKQKIFTKLEKDGYITDSELAKIYGKEPNFYQAETWKAEWRNFKTDKEKFGELENKKSLIIRHSGRKYLIRDSSWENLYWYGIHKEYYEYLKKLGVVELSSEI